MIKPMFMMRRQRTLWAGALLFCAGLSACEKDAEIVSSKTQTEEIAQEEAIADDVFEDADAISFEAVAMAENARMTEDSVTRAACVSHSIERTSYAKTVTLVFADGCVGESGRERSGTVVVKREFDPEVSTFTVTTTFTDFFLEGKKIEGTRTLVFSKEEDNIINIKASLLGAKVTLADGRVITRSGEFTKSINRKTGEVSLQGAAEGITRKGIAYASAITEPMIFKRSCAQEGVYMAVQGKKEITRTGKADFAISYGSGECDKKVTVDAEGEKYEVELTITKK